MGIKERGEEYVGTVSTDGEAAGGEVRWTRGRAQESLVSVMGSDVIE